MLNIERAMPAGRVLPAERNNHRTGYARRPDAPGGTETTIERAMPAAGQK